ncbi:hypothetical protein [Nisaea sediminum]|uniref:hypothetical protein n=1 Tax=Nisaea sediminum TaxID=2775867 RepID=UPI0018669812|nr:hypothetical protein [Nisaea sediminum]
MRELQIYRPFVRPQGKHPLQPLPERRIRGMGAPADRREPEEETEVSENETFESWAIVELMGHRKIGGKVGEQTIAGANLLRVDIYEGEGESPKMTQFYGGGAIYCLTPCAEHLARAFGDRYNAAAPVTEYDLPRLTRRDRHDDGEGED